MQAIAQEETILYAIPIQEFKKILPSNPKVLDFLLESFASNTRNPRATEAKGRLISSNYTQAEKDTTDLDFFQQVFYTKNPQCLSPDSTVQQAARLMNAHKISSLIIQENNLPIGIVTDKDIRRWVATEALTSTDKVSDLMSKPVKCIPPLINLAEVQSLLLQYQIGHLCVTQDGSNQSEIKGIISEHDIVTAQANNPVALLKQIGRVSQVEDLIRIRKSLSKLLKAYLETSLPMTYIMQMSRLITQALVKRVVELSLEEKGQPPVKFAWLGIGSQGRGEQILLTDQDHVLIFEDVEEEKYSITQEYFLRLATLVSQTLNQIGYVYCPANMMASNAEFCLSLSQWIDQFTQ
jgi:CBS domain-containing protein